MGLSKRTYGCATHVRAHRHTCTRQQHKQIDTHKGVAQGSHQGRHTHARARTRTCTHTPTHDHTHPPTHLASGRWEHRRPPRSRSGSGRAVRQSSAGRSPSAPPSFAASAATSWPAASGSAAALVAVPEIQMKCVCVLMCMCVCVRVCVCMCVRGDIWKCSRKVSLCSSVICCICCNRLARSVGFCCSACCSAWETRMCACMLCVCVRDSRACRANERGGKGVEVRELLLLIPCKQHLPQPRRVKTARAPTNIYTHAHREKEPHTQHVPDGSPQPVAVAAAAAVVVVAA